MIKNTTLIVLYTYMASKNLYKVSNLYNRYLRKNIPQKKLNMNIVYLTKYTRYWDIM